MASILGIKIEDLEGFLDHENIKIYRGNLFLKERKIAFWEQDYMANIYDSFNMEPGYSEEKLRVVVEKFRDPEVMENLALEILLRDLIWLMQMETLYETAVKDGYTGVLVTTDGYHMIYWEIRTKGTKEDVLNEYKTDLDMAHKDFLKNSKIRDEYYTGGSFDVGPELSLEEIIE